MASTEQVNAFLDKFDEADTKKKGALDQSQFKVLVSEVMAGRTDDETADMYFKGIDIDNSKTVSKEEFKDFVIAALTNDQEYILKMAFRSIDTDRSRSLDSKEIKKISKYLGQERTDEEIEDLLTQVIGKKSGKITYPQLVKILVGKEIDPKSKEADPYDGKLKSSCCNLL
ncbi:EF hand family protein [Histomonas meleagridis]|uniref:EF hand family protein n=1 Tax=Histomonas meleagridis TaxID=135588 RepID=UPI003559F61F|nr:EF hand family protein [Histomonas meleagridis]KAH0803585.1 EF hand family protein [Histomonas meleagridis]